MRGTWRAALIGLAALFVGGSGTALAQTSVGPETKLPLPRYVSLKTDRVNLREGPSKDHRTTWVFQHAGLPVEIVAEFENWRRIRDAEGTDGWVWHTLLSGRRTALVTPWARKEGQQLVDLRERADEASGVVARLQPGVIASVKQCTGTWCRLGVTLPSGGEVEGFAQQDKLWGVYPNERLE